MANDKFKFFLPAELVKASDNKGQEVMMFKGIASTSDKDSQDESLDPSTFDLRESLWINWNHASSKDPSTIIGETTKKEITANNELYIEGYLYPEVPAAKATYTLMKALHNSPSGNKLGISVEGKVIKRASEDKNSPLYNKILKAKISGAALCPVPINGRTWADILKGEIDSEEEEFDEETQKAMTAADGDGVTSKESIEGAKKELKKSEIFEQIRNHFPEIDIEKAKSVYQIIEKISTMENKEKKITDETLSKAFQILGLAKEAESAEGAAAATPAISTTISKSEGADDEDEDEKEMVEKAGEKCKVMKSEGKTDEEIKNTLIKKGFGEAVITKALNASPKVDGLSKSEVANIVKSALAPYVEKIDAITKVIANQHEENENLKKSVETISLEKKGLEDKLEAISKQSNGPKSFISKSYTDRPFNATGEQSNSSNSTTTKFNINNPLDRKNLKAVLLDKSGIMKGEKFDENLAGIAQDVELTGKIHKSQDLLILKNHGIEIVTE